VGRAGAEGWEWELEEDSDMNEWDVEERDVEGME